MIGEYVLNSKCCIKTNKCFFFYPILQLLYVVYYVIDARRGSLVRFNNKKKWIWIWYTAYGVIL